MNPLISVIIPNYQGKEVFPNCIKSLLNQDYHTLQIVFVDDSSTDGSFDLAKKLYSKEKRVTIVRTLKNSGYTGACNYALKFCKGEYIIVTNNDATFPKNWVSQMYSTVKGKNNVIGASEICEPGRIESITTEHKAVNYTLTGLWTYRKTYPIEQKNRFYEVFATGVLIIPRKSLDDEIFPQYYFAYCEDIELCWRMRMRGFHIIINHDAKMNHLGSFTKKKDTGFSKRAVMNGTKNRVCNILVLCEKKNIFRILPAFAMVDLAALLSMPKAIPYRLKGYWWVLTHPKAILQHRKKIQQKRLLPDKDIFKMISCELMDPDLATTPLKKRTIKIANSIMRLYCRMVFLNTYDRDNPKAKPVIDNITVTRPSK